MYYLTDLCFMCLKNNVKLQSVFIQDNDGILLNEKLRCCFPEIINSTPDVHKLACRECLEKLRFLYDFKQSVIQNNTVVNNYLSKLQYEDKTLQQPSVVLATRKRRRKVSSTENFSEIKVENVGNSFKLKIKNLNLSYTNKQLKTVDHSCQTTANGNVLLTKYNCLTEEKNLEINNVEKVVPGTETGTIYVKQELQFSEDDTTTNSLDKEIMVSKDAETIYIKQEPQFSGDDSTRSHLDKEGEDSTGINSSNEDDPSFEMSEEGTSRPNATNKQKVNTILNTLKPCYVSNDSVKFCNTCQELLFKDLNNINLHLYTHIQSSNCSRCEDSLEEINKFQRHMFNHCETMFEILDKGEHGEKFPCALCGQQFDEFGNLKKHIHDKHIRSSKCVVCSRSFTYKPNLLRHILMTHCQVKLYKCKLCPTRFTCKEGIKDHVIYQHYNGKVCICKFCHHTFRNPKALREHISRFHEEDVRLEEDTTHDSSERGYVGDRLSCAICHKQFNDLDNLKKHIYDNHVNNMKCEICFKSFSKRTGTFRHILETHCRVKIYNCIICAKKFSFKQSFEDHMISDHNSGNTANVEQVNKVIVPENGENFSCGICGRLYYDYERFKKHIYAKHMPSLDCVICSGSYTRRITLHRHILEQHCDVKLFKCIICFMQFTSEDSFKTHMIYQHNDGKTVTEPENNVFPVILPNKDKLSCAVCNKQLDSFERLKRHIYDDHITGLDCVVCSRTCSRREYLNRHILEQHCHLKIINCKLCPQRFACKESFKNHMIQLHSSDKISAELNNKVNAVIELDKIVGAVTDLDKKVGAVTELDNKFGASTELNNKVGAVTELDNKFGAITELDNKMSAVIEPEEVFIKDEPHYSDEYYSSDEEFEADNYETGKDFSNFAITEESNSRTSNSYDLEESVGSSVIPTATATTAASYCEPGAPVDQSDVCVICQKMSLYLSNLSEHLNAHMQESSCSMCKDSAENISRLQRHMLTPCGNTNTPQDSASAADTRTNDKVTCVVCQQEFKFNLLKKHLYAHITNLTCVVCNLTITNKQNLRRHLLHHCNLKPLQCEVCGKSFSVKASLKYHVENAHSSEVIACQYCQAEFKNTRSLHNHIKKLHPQNTYRCEVCKKIFLHKNELEKHAKLHTFSQ